MVPGNTKNKGGKMMSLINYRLKVTLNDGRNLIGQMLAFDKHMNLVLAECEEFRKVKSKKSKGEDAAPAAPQEMKRTLGLVILRGETVVSISIEGPPPKEAEESASLAAGPGKGLPAGRGMGLGGGIPPSMAARPMPYARPPPGVAPMGFPGMPGMMPPGFAAPPPGFRPPPMGFPGAPPGFPPPGFRPPQ